MTNPAAEEKKSEVLTILLAFLMFGVGHMYLGLMMKGTIILIVAFAIGFPTFFFLGWWGTIILTGYWIWQIYDAAKTHERMFKSKQYY